MKKKLTRLFALVLALVAICALFASCSAKNNTAAEDRYPGDAEIENEKNDVSGGFIDTETSMSVSATTERKVIKTFHIESETKEFDAAVASLSELITACGGYVESSSSSNKSLNNSSASFSRYANYTIRIPAERAEEFVNSVGTRFHVTSNQSGVEDISETYYSIEARLEELKAERDSLLDILEQPETKKDYDMWLTVKQRLSEVAQQIAVYQGQINRYDSKIAYSTVHLSIREVINYSEISQNRSFGSRLGAAFREGWNNFVVELQDFTIWFAQALPTLVLLGVIAAVAGIIVRMIVKKKHK